MVLYILHDRQTSPHQSGGLAGGGLEGWRLGAGMEDEGQRAEGWRTGSARGVEVWLERASRRHVGRADKSLTPSEEQLPH